MLTKSTRPVVLPYPREMKLAGGKVKFAALALRHDCPVAKQAAKALKRSLKDLKLPVADDGYLVTLVLLDEPDPALGPEFYDLQIGKEGTLLAGATYAGLYYGVQTLLQLIQPLVGGEFQLPCGTVTDWPLMPLRGLHTYLPAREDLPFFKRFIEWLGRHKINTMFLEVGGGMEYKRHPEVNAAWERFGQEALAYPGGPDALQDSQWWYKNSTHTELAGGSYLTQKELRQIAKWCADNAIEIMPEVQSLSHSYYLTMAHPEIAEIAADPWPDNYCPSNELSYQLYFELLEEIIEVLDPRLIHIGHDEAYIFNFCEKCKTRDAAEIYATDINRIRDWCAERGIRVAIWGDKLLNIKHPNGVTYGGVERNVVRYGQKFHLPATNRCVDLIAKDVLIFDWYWSLSYDSATMLADKGFQMIYGNFHAPRFENWTKHRENPSLIGGETSLWCRADEYSIGRNGTFHALLWGANDLWSDFDPDAGREQLVADIAATLRHDRLRLGKRPSVLQAPLALDFTPLDLTVAAARGLYPGDTPEISHEGLPRGRKNLGGVPFLIPGNKQWVGPLPGVDWHTRSTPPIPVDQPAAALAFLHTSTLSHVHAPTYYSLDLGPNLVGAYAVTYADGQTVEVPLEFAWNIDTLAAAYMGGGSGDQGAKIGAYDYAADPVVRGVTADGQAYTVFMYEWVNPRPEVPIRDVRLLWRAGYTNGVIALLGLTAVRTASD